MVDSWVEKLTEKGKEIITKERMKYEDLRSHLNEIDGLTEDCENEILYLEGTLPMLGHITKLSEEMVEQEGLILVEYKGIQYTLE